MIKEIFKGIGKVISMPFKIIWKLIKLIGLLIKLILVLFWEAIKITIKWMTKHRFKILATIVIIYLIFQFLFIPYIIKVANNGYDLAMIELANGKIAPLWVNQGGEDKILPIEICSEFFKQQYQNVCGVQG